MSIGGSRDAYVVIAELLVVVSATLRRSTSLPLLLADAGMDPGCAKSGQWSGKIKMSKRGNVALHHGSLSGRQYGSPT